MLERHPTPMNSTPAYMTGELTHCNRIGRMFFIVSSKVTSTVLVYCLSHIPHSNQLVSNGAYEGSATKCRILNEANFLPFKRAIRMTRIANEIQRLLGFFQVAQIKPRPEIGLSRSTWRLWSVESYAPLVTPHLQ